MNFADTFELLTGNRPFPWQENLFQDWFGQGKFPTTCNLPTGQGKTSVIAVWLIALAENPGNVPRRLVYVVNRRTVVDQTTSEVERYRSVLQTEPKLQSLRDKLASQCALPLSTNKKSDSPLALSTLRGQFADNREWSADPTRPAVIVGTVDMVGSRLLFSGYGVGFKMKPLHAGFLGQDVFLVHDEAHLEPAFQHLLQTIQHEQKKCGDLFPFRVMEMSATSRGEDSLFTMTTQECSPPDILPEPATQPIHIVWKRQKAKKTIHLYELAQKKSLVDEITEKAKQFAQSEQAILIFLQKVDDVEKVVDNLRKAKLQTQQLTGTLRGLERYCMADPRNDQGCPIFARFLKQPNQNSPAEDQWKISPATGTVYLVCTSAGEVGVNISADHLVCDLSTFESMAQRFGRINRFGDYEHSEIHIVYPAEQDLDKDEMGQRRKKTLELLRQLNGDGSPKALNGLELQKRLDAFAPLPVIMPASDILFDAWSLTTIRQKMPGRPSIEPYLHGVSGWEPAETHVAWREDVSVFHQIYGYGEKQKQAKSSRTTALSALAADWLEDYPLKAHELLRDNVDRVFNKLKNLQTAPNTPIWLVSGDGSIELTSLQEVRDRNKSDLRFKTVLLPPSAGGLEKGMLVAKSDEANKADDVSDELLEGTSFRRRRLWDTDPNLRDVQSSMRLIRIVDTRPDIEDNETDSTTPRFWYWYELAKVADGEGSGTNKKPVSWKVHTDDVTKNAALIVSKLPLTEEIRSAIRLAAMFHDLGKKRALWQRSIGNDHYPKQVLAKSGGNMKPRALGSPYRHEFGSIVDVLDSSSPSFQELTGLTTDMQDLVLHLIATHHGFGRPHFPLEYVFDPEPKKADVEQMASEIPRRFARLQRKYGRWGLAYLESLIRAADYAASAEPSKFEEEDDDEYKQIP